MPDERIDHEAEAKRIASLIREVGAHNVKPEAVDRLAGHVLAGASRTPPAVTVEERIDHAHKRRAELIIEDVNDLESRNRNIAAFQREARGVARDYLALLTEHSAPCGHGCFPETGGSFVCGRPIGHDGLHASFYGHGAVWNDEQVQEGFLDALPATEPAQPDIITHVPERPSCEHCPDAAVACKGCAEPAQPEEEQRG